MRISVLQLKEAFYAECNRSTNLSLGRSFFQLYEVALFLNSAYLSCCNKRFGILDERFIPQDRRNTNQAGATTMPDSMRTLLDFGGLYHNALLSPLDDEHSSINGYTLATTGERGVLFELGTYDKRQEPAYIINASLIEFDNKKKKVMSYLCKPMAVADAPKYSLFYQNNKYLPYVYYRLKPLNTHHVDKALFFSDLVIDTFVMAIELNTPNSVQEPWKRDYWKLNVDCINFPKPITEADLNNDSRSKDLILPVMFGYEIAMEAAKLAMESLGNQRSNSLAQMANSQMGNG